ncbi:peptidylprolyl isomerase [Geobacter sp. AOG1]|uniref:peptidylprolyl isomerase n=1 Tax=Geobacter sp. AOG1 TaxID=1566346 RepID=UPI001E03F77C|nr:peptidylprolyl isomerase [Geobacter sp. AOG1]GFE57009.1 chaperone SurA [Geobacter sp. AOG1]
MNTLLKIILLIALAILPALSAAEMVSGIAAIVNDEIITSYDVDKETANLVKEAEKKGPVSATARGELRSSALNRLIDRKLTEQKIKELDIKVSEEEVRQSIEDVKKQNNLSQEALVAALAGQGLSFDQYKAQLKDQLERLRLMSQEVRAKIQVGEREMQEYYAANPTKFGAEEQFRARHIFFRLGKDATTQDIRRVMMTAANVLFEARSGKDFAELARKYSDDPGAKTDGGELGTFKKGEMLPEIETTVLKMNPGEISELVVTTAGIHIIKLEGRSAGKPKPFDEVKGEIEDALYRKKSEERFNQWLADLRKSASIEIK